MYLGIEMPILTIPKSVPSPKQDQFVFLLIFMFNFGKRRKPSRKERRGFLLWSLTYKSEETVMRDYLMLKSPLVLDVREF